MIKKTHNVQHIDEVRDQQIIDECSEDLIKYILQFLPNVSIATVKSAMEFATKAHQYQKRSSGEPYITHPIAVAKILAELHLDTVTIVGALLHDVVEDTEYTLGDISEHFGKKMADIVAGLTKLNKLECHNVITAKAENLRKLLIAVAEDARVLLIKLADRLHNMRTLSALSDYKRRMRIARDTIDIYAPLAERIGIHFFKNTLYDLAFEALYPDVRQSILDQVEELKKIGYNDIARLVEEISSLMSKYKLDIDVQGREKTPFSIWQKMEKKKVSFDEVSDIFAVRIITQKPLDCYLALGLIHMNYKVLSKEFFDYISTPKQNGYRSIHTVILVTDSLKVEIQIRTDDMHEISELGMSAHWIYKQNNTIASYEYQQLWLQNIRTIMANITDAADILSSIKLDMYYDQVFCFTPKGDIVTLPQNATPLDFAFELSPDLGSRYSKAFVNGKNVSICTKLKSGDQVQIMTSDQIMITHHWFDVVSTSNAKQTIQGYLEKKLFDSLVFSGNLSIQEECDKQNIHLNSDQLQRVAYHYNTNIDNVLFNIGNGSIKVENVVEKLYQNNLLTKLGHFFKNTFNWQSPSLYPIQKLTTFKVNTEIQFTYCCTPQSGEVAIGIYDKAHKSIILHSKDCCNAVQHKDIDQINNILLAEVIYDIAKTKVDITIMHYNVASSIFVVFTEFGISQYAINVYYANNNYIILRMEMQLVIAYQLSLLVNRIKNLPDIMDVVVL